MWIFGYGSLVWRPDFPHLQQRRAYVRGFARRFFQASTDHRGVPGRPGRVVTLLEAPGAAVGGLAYEVAREVYDEVLAKLDHREKNGYARHEVELFDAASGGAAFGRALVYMATPENASYLGPAPLDEIARQVAEAVGPSGPNDEYVLELARALRALEVDDAHVFAVEGALLDLQRSV